MTGMNQKCLIWGTPAMVAPDGTRDAFRVDSPRAGGKYRITGTVLAIIENGVLDDRAKALLTTALVNRRREGDNAPEVDSRFLTECKERTALSHAERADRLLAYIAERELASPGGPVRMEVMDPGALAHSESWSSNQGVVGVDDDLEMLVKYLENNGWLEVRRPLGPEREYRLTVDGHNHLEGAKTPKTTQAFVAMWFSPEMRDAYDHGIAPGIRDAGFTPCRIDEQRDANKIDDAIIAEIKRSRFVVADMTHGHDGVRGSVYFEAGYASGLGRDVIYSCREDCLDKLAFDTRQYRHIVWKAPEGLRTELTKTIRARIGSTGDRETARGEPMVP